MSVITPEHVAHLAKLSRLALTDAELAIFAQQFDAIVAAVARIQDVAATDVPATSHVVELSNVFRSDEIQPCLTRQQALAAAPRVEDNRFQVPQILGEES